MAIHSHHQYPGTGLSRDAPSPPSMNNFFTNKANSDRLMYGISQRLNKNRRGKILNAISTI
jgi:hypothetical protein